MSELARFLISKLNRTNKTLCSEMLEAQSVFTKRVLQVVEVLHNKEATALAKRSIELLGKNASTSEIEQFRQLWVNFITTYDDSFLEKLTYAGTLDSSDLKKTIKSLNLFSNDSDKKVSEVDLSRISSLLVASLVPSVASSVNEVIATLSQKIQQDSSLLDTVGVQKEIKEAISLRIALDKKSVKDMISSLDGILDKLSLRLISMIESSDNSTIDIQNIKKELEAFNDESTSNFKIAHKKLLTIAVALEENTQDLSQDLKTHSSEVEVLSKKIQELEEELISVKQESKEDFLTKLYNRRALDEFLEVKEAEFERHGHNFSVIMFDLDKFKDVNDNFGHDAGDAVLSAFAKILKKEARTEDVVGRFGGEEFMAILSETDTKGGVIFAQKVRKHVEKARFMYKGERIAVTVSCGVSERKLHSSLQSSINSADEYLYTAKNSGRNQVAYKK
jgi:diguanylate cyclase (GGDEF)-like protein